MHARTHAQTMRLQRRCYWLLESEDDIVLVHYLNIDKAKGKAEEAWPPPADADLVRRSGFTVTSGGVHGLPVRQLMIFCFSCKVHGWWRA
jgi:hypothetical protein